VPAEQELPYVRVVTAHGVSRFDTACLPLLPGANVPPGLAVTQTQTHGVTALIVVRLPAGWSRARTTPARQWMIVLTGTVEVATHDEVRRFGPGELVLAEDTDGTGHTTTAIDDVTLAVIRI
jgi:hypothetical protein